MIYAVLVSHLFVPRIEKNGSCNNNIHTDKNMISKAWEVMSISKMEIKK